MNPSVLFLLESVPAGRVFALDQQTLIQIGIQLFNAVLLAAALAFILYNPVRNAMRRRTERVAEQLIQAREAMDQANELKLLYEKRLNEIQVERDEILSAANKLAAGKSKQIISEAKYEAEIVKARAEVDIKMEMERVSDEMKQSIIDLSSAMAARLMEQFMDQETHDRLLARGLADLEDMSWPN